MKKKYIRGGLSILIALVLVLGLVVVPEFEARADEEFEEVEKYHSDDLETQVVEIEGVSEEEKESAIDESNSDLVVFFSEKATDNYWSDFRQPYYYSYANNLNANQRKFYDRLYSTLYSMIDGSDNNNLDGYTPIVKYSDLGLSQNAAKNVAFLMLYNQPELYFLNGTIGHYSDGSGSYIRIGIYSDFNNASARYNAANNIRTKINWYLNQVNASSTVEKERQIHDLLISNVTYTSSAPYNQSCASVFLNNKSVCAGYAEAFCLLCKRIGIPTFSVTSEDANDPTRGHEWSQVKLGNYWYAVDVTWDDNDWGSPKYTYFNKSDSSIRKNDTGANAGMHTPEALWSSVGRETCPYDYGSEPSVTSTSTSTTKPTSTTSTSTSMVRGTTYFWGADYSSVYDYNYYLSHNPDVKAAYGGDENLTIAHFVFFGRSEGRQGNANFNVMGYKNRYLDLRRAFGNELYKYYDHYMRYGIYEGRDASYIARVVKGESLFFGVDFSPVYDFRYYQDHNPDVKAAFGNDDMATFAHFLLYGIYEGRQASANFNIWTYITNYADLRNAYGWNINDYILHYIIFGIYEGRRAA